MSFRAAASMGAIQALISIASGFVSVKITSVFLGPAGIGVLSQLQYFMAMAQNGIMSGLNTGVVRRTAECGDDEPARALAVSTALRLVLLVGTPVALTLALASGWVAQEVLHRPEFQVPVLLFACTYLLGLIGALVQGTANGAKDYRSTAMINVGTVLATLILYALLCPTFGLFGGLLGAALVPTMTMLIGVAIGRKRAWWLRRPLAAGFSGRDAHAVLAFMPLAAAGAISQPLVQILIRQALSEHHGMAQVGMLQGVMRISDMYLGLATSILGMYFLPRFSEVRMGGKLRHELHRALLLIVPAVAVVSLTLYLLRDPIIHVVLTREFLPMRDLFGWQMTGNVFKIVAWLFGTLLVAKANPYILAGFELLTAVLWWGLGVAWVERWGAKGATMAYAGTYVAYSILALAWITWLIRRPPPEAAEKPADSSGNLP